MGKASSIDDWMEGVFRRMLELADRLEAEKRCQKLAEENDEMRELWSEYVWLKSCIQ